MNEGSGSSGSATKRALRKYTDEERRRWLEQYGASGLGIAEFSAKHGLPKDTLYGWLKRGKGQRCRGEGKRQIRQQQFSPEQRRQAVEAYQKSGLTAQDFAKTWGVDPATLRNWVKTYDERGPQGLERGMWAEPGKRRGRKPLAGPVVAEIVATKRQYPEYGFKKVRSFLMRFRGLKVSTGAIRKHAAEAELPPAARPQERKKKRKPRKIRFFERARPMQLWQTDITSYVLTRHSTRVYLVVFLDDHSRYIVSWALGLQQTGQWVVETLLGGIQRFGKPEEVLSDQGRQYFAWRGQGDFQKVLKREGIAHVVARSHHPQTLGKCERLWETIFQEFWERAQPQELSEARERLGHWVAHYNHFRPHQGLGDAAVPADRFFGVESDVRKTLEATYSQNELRLALGEAPRTPVFLIGQIGDQKVALHGEKGRLVVHAPDGAQKTMDYETFGHPGARATKGENDENRDEAGDEPRREPAADPRVVQGGRSDERADEDAASATQPELPAAEDAGGSGPGAVGGGDGRREEAGAHAVHRGAGVLARPALEGGGGEPPRDAAASSLATFPAGALGDDGGAARAAADLGPGSCPADADGRAADSGELATDRGVGEDRRDPGAADQHPEVDADPGHSGAGDRPARAPGAGSEGSGT